MKLSACSLWCLLALYLLAIISQLELAQARKRVNVETTPSEAASLKTKKSKILVIEGTRYFGKYVVEASVEAGHETVTLVSPSSGDDPEKEALIKKFRSYGVEIVYGDIDVDRETLVATIKKVDVIISCVDEQDVLNQWNIILAIGEAGNKIKRFFPSEYGIDAERVHDPVWPAKGMFEAKSKFRKLVRDAGIPHTFVVGNTFASGYWPNLAQMDGRLLPNITQAIAFGDGNSKIIATLEDEIATYVIKAVDDPRTLNKILYLRPLENTLSFNELFALWESMSGKTLEKTYLPADELLRLIQEAPAYEQQMPLSLLYSVAIKNDFDSYKIDPQVGVEATELYPEVKYTTVHDYLRQFLPDWSSSLRLPSEINTS